LADGPPGLGSAATLAVSFLSKLAAGKSAALDDKGEGGASIESSLLT